MTPKSRNVYFLETKSPCGVAPNIEEGLRIHPNKINSFLQKSGKVGFPQKSRIWWKFTYQNSLFTKNLNGLYGPYEQLLWDISPNKWPKNRVFDENSSVWKMTLFKILYKKALAVRLNSIKKLCKHLPEYSRVNPDQVWSEESYFHIIFILNYVIIFILYYIILE